jgi:hypothetical protein
MKRFSIGLIAGLFLFISVMTTGCYGPFRLTTNVYEWNGSVGDDVINEVVFLLFLFIPVYSVCLFIDGVILNTIEFWTGSNPIAMNEGEKEIKVVKSKGKTYKITAMKNRFEIEQKLKDGAVEHAVISYNPDNRHWYLNSGENIVDLGYLNQSGKKTSFIANKPNGEKVEVETGKYSRAQLKKMFLN